MFIENVVMVIWWIFVIEYSFEFKVVMFIIEGGIFLIGVFLLMLFYCYFYLFVVIFRDEVDVKKYFVFKIFYKRVWWEK